MIVLGERLRHLKDDGSCGALYRFSACLRVRLSLNVGGVMSYLLPRVYEGGSHMLSVSMAINKWIVLCWFRVSV